MPQEIWNPYAHEHTNQHNQQKDMLSDEMRREYPFYDPEKPFLVKDLAEMWFVDIRKIIRPSTYNRYHNYSRRYILPYVGNMRAEVFDKTALSAMLGLLRGGHSQREPLSQYTVYFIESMVRAMFRYGAERNLVPEIYFGKSEYKIQSKRYAMPLSELEMLQLVHVVEQKELDVQVQILLPLYTGLSLSEVCGLKWADIDMENKKIHVYRNLVRIQKKTEENETGTGKRKPMTKLAECELPETSRREFTMPEKVYELLSAVEIMRKPAKEDYVAELEKKKGKEENKGNEVSEKTTIKASLEVPVLGTDKKTTPPDPRSLQYRLKTVGEEAGLSNLTYQIIRDTFAMLSLTAGGDAYSVSCVMGVGVNVICDRYGPWLMKNDGFMKGIG